MSHSPDAEARIILSRGRERAALRGHPWIFSGAVHRTQGEVDSPVARVFTGDGRQIGLGFHNPGARVRVAMVGEVESLDRAFFAERLAAALRLRREVVSDDTTGYRVLNGEGDGIPGWIVDRYGDLLVSQIAGSGLEALRGLAYEALGEAFPNAAILQSNDLAVRRRGGLGTEDEVIAGEPHLVSLAEAAFTESGYRFTAEVAGGQKTGFYCDQRENRRLAAAFARDRAMLDLFAHTGAFAVHALGAGAARVTAIESAARLAPRAAAHLRDNGFDTTAVEWVTADVFDDLRERRERYGLVVCDPPPLAPRRRDVAKASRAYKDLNRLALARTEPGGFFLTFTCSSAIDAKLLRQILFAAADEAKAPLSLLQPLGAAPDHPFAITHPEGEYLKGWLGRVRG